MMRQDEQRRLWTVKDVANYLKVSTQWVYRELAARNLRGDRAIPAYKLPGGPWRFDPDKIMRWVEHALESAQNES